MKKTRHFLEPLLQPASIAVIGAGDDPLKINGRSLMFMLRHGAAPRIYPVNPGRDTVQDITCYRRVADLPETPDVGMVIVKKKLVPGVFRDLGEKGCPFVIITSAGYAETGSKGILDQQALVEIAASYGIRFMGPNCLGLVSLHGPVILSWCATLEREKNELLPGDVGMISQSGALLGSIWDAAIGRGLRFSHLLSTGNEANLDISDFISYFAQDDKTKVITCFVEGLRKPEAFIRSVNECHQQNKPVVIYKVGRTAASARAAHSHTGALTGSDDTFDAICRRYGVIRMNSLNGLIAAALALREMPAAKGNRLGVFTSSGGAAGLISDRLQARNLRMADVSPSFQSDMDDIFNWGPLNNPTDIAKGPLKSFDIISTAMTRFYEENTFDLIIILMTMMYFQKIAPTLMLKGLPGKLSKPVLACWIGDKVAREPAMKMSAGGVPTFHDTESVLDAADALHRWGCYQQRVAHHMTPPPSIESRRQQAWSLFHDCHWRPNEHISKQVLALYGVQSPVGKVIGSMDEARQLAPAVGYPLVAKALSPTLPHKTEFGVVHLGIRDEKELHEAIDLIHDAFSGPLAHHHLQGILIENQCPSPLAETIVGSVYDEIGFHKILFGLGGIFAEVLKDTSIRLAPLSADDAGEMLTEIKGAPILTGARGRVKADLHALEEIIISVSTLVVDFKDQLLEIDINPLFVYPTGAVAVDALIRFKEGKDK